MTLGHFKSYFSVGEKVLESDSLCLSPIPTVS